MLRVVVAAAPASSFFVATFSPPPFLVCDSSVARLLRSFTPCSDGALVLLTVTASLGAGAGGTVFRTFFLLSCNSTFAGAVLSNGASATAAFGLRFDDAAFAFVFSGVLCPAFCAVFSADLPFTSGCDFSDGPALTGRVSSWSGAELTTDGDLPPALGLAFRDALFGASSLTTGCSASCCLGCAAADFPFTPDCDFPDGSAFTGRSPSKGFDRPPCGDLSADLDLPPCDAPLGVVLLTISCSWSKDLEFRLSGVLFADLALPLCRPRLDVSLLTTGCSTSDGLDLTADGDLSTAFDFAFRCARSKDLDLAFARDSPGVLAFTCRIASTDGSFSVPGGTSIDGSCSIPGGAWRDCSWAPLAGVLAPYGPDDVDACLDLISRSWRFAAPRALGVPACTLVSVTAKPSAKFCCKEATA
ncbi:hypothetical protein BOVATA_015240 [Babesia ovata]|uniref:Uncharacterized protein n=1 Tax=Babesia ovata TaxID=189622 RepID=A0A2H6KAK5_9APIC|nr:uncharacterized protein BOVATA_015240 [Babesia ovata]GBE60031.1 hypothetical protein BOVATA_015240 [Babesia ovata]